MDTKASLQQSYRQYSKSNREAWSDLGFRYMTCLVHDDERALVLAEMELRKCVAMIATAENAKTPEDVLRQLSMRNMTVLPSTGELSALDKRVVDSTAKTTLMAMLDIARNYKKRYRGIEAQYEKIEDHNKRVRMAARAVAYSGACSAQVRVVGALLDFMPLKDTSIFGMNPVDDDGEEP